MPKALHQGEIEAISLARELGADWVLIDERKASRAAESRGLRVAGTLGILEEAGARNLFGYEQGRDRLVNETNFYVTDDVLRESERRYHERKQAQEEDRKTQEQAAPTPPSMKTWGRIANDHRSKALHSYPSVPNLL